MTGRLGLLLIVAVLGGGCSGLEEGAGGVVGIEVSVPGPDTVEVGESVQLSARPLDKNGDSVGTPVAWISADPAASVDGATGVLTGVAPGSARVQATVGTLGSELITFAVVAPADTLLISGDSILSVTIGAATLPALPTVLQSFHPVGPVPNRAVIYAITSPDPAVAPPTVTLAGGAVVDTLLTGTDGTATTTLAVAAGGVPPDSVIVELRAQRTRGAGVPGSGQRFIVRFQP